MKNFKILLLLIATGCFNNKIIKIDINKEKGYLKTHLKPEEIKEFKVRLKKGNADSLCEFLILHRNLLIEYPIIIKIMKTDLKEISKETQHIKKFDLLNKILSVMNKDEKKIALNKIGKMQIKTFGYKKLIISPLMAIAYQVPQGIVRFLDNFMDEFVLGINGRNLVLGNGRNIEIGMTTLMFAALSDEKEYSTAAIEKLIEKGADYKYTIVEAIIQDYKGIALKLIEIVLKKELNVKDSIEKEISITKAIESGDEELLSIFTKFKFILGTENPLERTALHNAVHYNQIDMVKLLLEDPAIDINAKDKFGKTSLHIAACLGRDKIAELLINKMTNINIVDYNYERTALHYASEFDKKEIGRLLIEKNAELNVRDKRGFTPLSLAACCGHEELVKILLQKGADVSISDIKGMNALHHAVINGHKAITKLLLENGADANSSEENGWTALHFAATHDQKGIAKLLLKNRAKVDAREKLGWTPLHKAVYKNHIKLVKLFINNGADVNAKSMHDTTILHCVTSIEVAKMLLKKGAGINARDKKGLTPLNVVSLANFGSVSKFLKAEGATF